eukprot:476545_1
MTQLEEMLDDLINRFGCPYTLFKRNEKNNKLWREEKDIKMGSDSTLHLVSPQNIYGNRACMNIEDSVDNISIQQLLADLKQQHYDSQFISSVDSMNKCQSFQKIRQVLNNCKTYNIQQKLLVELLNDFNHLIQRHSEQFEEIFTILSHNGQRC